MRDLPLTDTERFPEPHPKLAIPDLLRAGMVGLAVTLAALPVLSAGPGAVGVAILAYGAAFARVAQVMRRAYPHDRFGACNLVTLCRAGMVAALLGAVAGAPEGGQAAGWAVAVVAGIGLALDGIDGWLARRSGLVSDVGARFDLEVDAALALVLALHVLSGTAVGAEVLVLGSLRYVFVAAGWIAPWLRGDLPFSQRRRVICVVQIAALIFLVTPLAGDDLAIWTARLATAALVWSFAVDVAHLWRVRA